MENHLESMRNFAIRKKKKKHHGPINYAQREFIKYEFKYIYIYM